MAAAREGWFVPEGGGRGAARCVVAERINAWMAACTTRIVSG